MKLFLDLIFALIWFALWLMSKSNAWANIDFFWRKVWTFFKICTEAKFDEAKHRVFSKQTNDKTHNVNSISDYFKVSLAISLINIVLSELKRGFKANQTFHF